MEPNKEQQYTYITAQKNAQRKAIAVLLDPDKYAHPDQVPYSEITKAKPDFIFVGGSGINHSIDDFVLDLKKQLTIPIVLFPGGAQQFSPHADSLLLLSLVSGRNPDLLIGQHIQAAQTIVKSNIEVLPTGYILIDGGNLSSVARVSQTQPISTNDTNLIVSTALAAQLLGMKLIYLEAGSGATHTIPSTIIQTVRQTITLPLIVGGGICSIQQIDTILQAGADIIVIGNHFESHPNDIVPFSHYVHNWSEHK